MESKSPSESHTVLERFVLPADINGFNTLYGGKLMEWIDNIAGIAAAKHSREINVTGSIDGLFFLSPIRLGDIVKMEAWINYVTKSTMEVEVDVFCQGSLTGINKFTTQAFLTYVAVDKNGRPTTVPGLKLKTKEEKSRFEDGRKRSELRHSRLGEIRKDAMKFRL